MLTFWRKRARVVPPALPAQPGVRMTWYCPPQQHVDTVVFVHGILGHFAKTWGEFPRLLSEDEELPELDILLWGYRTGIFARHHELKIEGGHFATSLQNLVRDGTDIVLVGHSMGGLVILKALVDRMALGEAQQHPCKAITWITLFATPLNGAWLAGLAYRLAAIPLHILRSLHKHLRDLSRGPFVESLMGEVRERIYAPGTNDPHNRKIPIRIIAATRDGAVDKANRNFALAPYTNPAAFQLDETHASIKLPLSREELRYKVLATDLQVAIARTFRRLCAVVHDQHTSVDDREVSLHDMRRRYGKLIGLRLSKIKVPAESLESAEGELLLLIAAYGVEYEEPPFSVIHRAATALGAATRSGDEWRFHQAHP